MNSIGDGFGLRYMTSNQVVVWIIEGGEEFTIEIDATSPALLKLAHSCLVFAAELAAEEITKELKGDTYEK